MQIKFSRCKKEKKKECVWLERFCCHKVLQRSCIFHGQPCDVIKWVIRWLLDMISCDISANMVHTELRNPGKDFSRTKIIF